MSKLSEKSIALLSVTTVTHAAIAAVTLYTGPVGKVYVPDHVKILGAGNEAATIVSFGRVGALTDFLGNQTLSNLDAAGDMVRCAPIQSATPVKEKTYAAGVVFQVDVTTNVGNAGNIYMFFGTLRDA